jgi:hypothetical protein
VDRRPWAALFDGFTLSALWPDGGSTPLSNSINDIAHVGDSTYVTTKDRRVAEIRRRRRVAARAQG